MAFIAGENGFMDYQIRIDHIFILYFFNQMYRFLFVMPAFYALIC